MPGTRAAGGAGTGPPEPPVAPSRPGQGAGGGGARARRRGSPCGRPGKAVSGLGGAWVGSAGGGGPRVGSARWSGSRDLPASGTETAAGRRAGESASS